MNLKSTSETKNTFTIVFDLPSNSAEKYEEILKIKALTLLLGNFNPLRKEMTNKEECYNLIQSIKNNGDFSDIINDLTNYLK